MTTREQVIAEARERILKAVDARVNEYREPLSNQPGWEWMKARGVLASARLARRAGENDDE